MLQETVNTDDTDVNVNKLHSFVCVVDASASVANPADNTAS